MDRAYRAVSKADHQLCSTIGVDERAGCVFGEVLAISGNYFVARGADRNALGGRYAIIRENDLDDHVLAVFVDGVELEARIG